MSDASARLAEALSRSYRIERELGQGGMATVYLAEDLKHHRKVAVKVLRPELAATLGPDRFFREIEVAAQLQHPHILSLFDSGEAGGFLYYVMPYVEGESLRDRLAHRGELPIHDAVKILTEVVDALAHHSHGVVHRDIKPDSVLLSGRHALVMDFGVAKAVSEATGRQKLTTAGVALGTPAGSCGWWRGLERPPRAPPGRPHGIGHESLVCSDARREASSPAYRRLLRLDRAGAARLERAPDVPHAPGSRPGLEVVRRRGALRHADPAAGPRSPPRDRGPYGKQPLSRRRSTPP